MLTDKEKTVLFMSISQGKSSWESSQMLGDITHYKFLEIRQRAERLFKLFADFFAIHPQIFNPQTYIDYKFRDYIYGVMVRRLPKEEAINYAGDSAWLLHPVRKDTISKNLYRLKFSKDQWDQDTFKLLVEFDRWNNFRVLPREYQAESAFNRKISKRFKVYVKYLYRIPDYKIRAIINRFWYSVRDPRKAYYTVVVSTMFPNGYKVMPIRKSDVIGVSKYYLYVFETIDDAIDYGVLVSTFFDIAVSNGPRGGLKFWKRYKELIQRTINSKYINNLDFNYTTLDAAYGLKKKNKCQKKKNG